MEPKIEFLCSQEPTTGPGPEQKSVHTLKPNFCIIHFKVLFTELFYDNFSIADYTASNNLIQHSHIHLSEIHLRTSTI
jgi:hypothetical protein